ncbi:MAG TPA: vWA domain-containing protein [Chryseosolibacter sp.]
MNSKNLLVVACLLLSPFFISAQARVQITDPASLTINHDPLEVDLTDMKTLVISNIGSGGANLSGTLAFINFTGDPAQTCSSCGYWSFVGGNTINLPGGSAATFTIQLSPPLNATPGAHAIKLRVTLTNALGTEYPDAWSATPELDVDISVNAQITKTTINYSLVLDRSGSMSAVECSTSRINLLAESASLFFDMTKLRKQDLPNFDGDSIGMVKFDDIVNADYLPLGAVTDAFITQGKELLDPDPPFSATSTESKIQPRGLTAIGQAVIDAINVQLPGQAPANMKKVVVLFSDGYENVAPYTNEVPVLNLLADRQDINIYTIGMGSADHGALQALSAASGLTTAQHYGFPNYSTTCDPYALANFYIKVYNNAIGLASIVDPTFYVSLSDSTSKTITSAWLTSSDRKATFVVFDPPAMRSQYTLDIVSPKGESISALTGGLSVTKIADFNYTIYEVNLTKATDPTSYIGRWDLKISPSISKDVQRRAETVPIGFSVSTFSNLRMSVNSAVAGNKPGNDLIVGVDVLDSGLPPGDLIASAASVTTPSGKVVKLNLVKDSYNQLVARYPHTYEEGIYKLFVNVKIKNRKGEIATREDVKHVVVGDDKQPVRPQKSCAACWGIYILVGLAFLILLLVIIFRWPR